MKICIDGISDLNQDDQDNKQKTLELSNHENPDYITIDSSVSMHVLLVKKTDLIKAIQALS